MAIKPSELNKVEDEDRQEIDQREKKIDAALKQMRRQGRALWIDAGLFGSGLVREALEKRYRDAGWHLRFYDDQRDGAVFEFASNPPDDR